MIDIKEKFISKLKRALNDGVSLNSEVSLWTLENFQNLSRITVENPDKTDGTFNEKITHQIKLGKGKDGNPLTQDQRNAVHALMIEVLTLYYFVPTNIKKDTKNKALNELINADCGTKISNNMFEFSISCLNDSEFNGIASGGMGYNTNKFNEIFYPVRLMSKWFKLDREERKVYIGNSFKFQGFIDSVEGIKNPQSRHALLHLLFSEQYEPIISNSEKNKLVSAFESIIDKNNEFADADIDGKILFIKLKLREVYGDDAHFYRDDIKKFWQESGVIDNGDSSTLLLEYKKQVILYGPPGTSKTYRAKSLAEDIIRHHLVKQLGSEIFEVEGKTKLDTATKKNIHRLQLHPAYTYEDFIRGMQFKEGNTVYKSGYLLSLIEKMQQTPELPHVLILDEINRVDLSRLFGECFSALENRDEKIDLIGSDDAEQSSLTIPNNLYIIGTMNLIDHSVEQIDFALRRRFLWIESNYNEEALLNICEVKWEELAKPYLSSNTYDKVIQSFNQLASAATNLNHAIENELELGRDFMLGHVFFIDALKFILDVLKISPRKSALFFNSKGDQWCEPIEKLWNYSLEPLLGDYLSGVDSKSREAILKNLKASFLPNL